MHVWDFSDRIEVRLADKFIEKLKTFKKAKTTSFTHYRSECKVTVKRSYSIFPIATSLGKRLFSEWDFHRGNKTTHLPFVTMPQLREIQRKTDLSLGEIERAVTHVRTGLSSLSVRMSFPITSNGDWAFLFGLWFGAGSYVTRFRKGNAQEMELRYAVDTRPFRELIKPLLLRLGYSDIELKTMYYAKPGKHHKLDAQKWREYGSEPRGFFILHRSVREIMEKFGLPDLNVCKALRGIKGGKSSFRQFSREIPKWVTYASPRRYSSALLHRRKKPSTRSSHRSPNIPMGNMPPPL